MKDGQARFDDLMAGDYDKVYAVSCRANNRCFWLVHRRMHRKVHRAIHRIQNDCHMADAGKHFEFYGHHEGYERTDC